MSTEVNIKFLTSKELMAKCNSRLLQLLSPGHRTILKTLQLKVHLVREKSKTCKNSTFTNPEY